MISTHIKSHVLERDVLCCAMGLMRASSCFECLLYVIKEFTRSCQRKTGKVLIPFKCEESRKPPTAKGKLLAQDNQYFVSCASFLL